MCDIARTKLNKMDRLNYIIHELKQAPTTGIFKVKETKREMLSFYTKEKERLYDIPLEQIQKYSFISELLQRCEQKEKASKTKQILARVKGLERHEYAPEMNKLIFNNDEAFYVPQVKTIEKDVEVFISKSSLTKIKKLIYRVKP